MARSKIVVKFAAFLQNIGSQGLLLVQAFGAAGSGRMDGPEFSKSLVRLGVHSLPVVIFTALFVGGIMVVQSAPLPQRFGAESLLGWGAGFGILREIGPILTGLMISGRVGSSNTAELGTLQVTEQINGLRALAIDPTAYLL